MQKKNLAFKKQILWFFTGDFISKLINFLGFLNYKIKMSYNV